MEYNVNNESLDAGGCIRTYGGNYIDIFDIDPSKFSIESIAHSLSMQCRFSGHTNEFYSVAQHCIMVCDLLPEEFKFEGLMHDASEAYICDIPSPIKPKLDNYKIIEDNLMKALSRKFGFNYPLSDDVKREDYHALFLEWNFLVTSNRWEEMGFELLSPKQAKEKFLEYYEKYKP